MEKLIVALCLCAWPAAARATDGPCLDTNIAVATEIQNMRAFVMIRGYLQHGVINAQLLMYLDDLIDLDEKYIAKMTRIGFPGHPVSGTRCDAFNVPPPGKPE